MRKTVDYYKASPAEKILYLAGIPKRYWHIDHSILVPRPIVTERTVINAERQQEWLDKMQEPEKLSGVIIGIGSDPTDDLALAAGFSAVRSMVQQRSDTGDVLVVDPANTQYDTMINPKIVMIHNVTVDSTRPRVQDVRDWLRCYEGVPRIVAVAGMDPVTFFDTRLYSILHYALYFEGKLTQRHRNL